MARVSSRTPAALRLVDSTLTGTRGGRLLTCQYCGEIVDLVEIGPGPRVDERRFVCGVCLLDRVMREPPGPTPIPYDQLPEGY